MKPKKPTKREYITTIQDEKGNAITVSENDKRIKLSLRLNNEPKRRQIGQINKAKRTLEVKRDRAKHLFRKLNAYGLNYKLIEDSKRFDTILIKDELSVWAVPKQFILTEGKILNFLAQGFEKQIFIELYKIEQFKKQPAI